VADHASVQSQPFICGICGNDEGKRIFLWDELHFAVNLFLTSANDLQMGCYAKIGVSTCKKEVSSSRMYIYVHVAVI
jgi:hypothetical protein